MSKPLEAYRECFPVTRTWAYLNHAATGPYPISTCEAIEGYARDCLSHGGIHYETWDRIREEVRTLASSLIHCAPDEVALVGNTSEGANIVAQGLDMRAGDNVVIPEGEFPANVYPWLNLERRGVEVRRVPADEIGPQRESPNTPVSGTGAMDSSSSRWGSKHRGRISVSSILKRVDARTRIVAVSSVAYHNGFRMDLKTLGEALESRSVPFYVDAIQSLGACPLDVKRIRASFLAADGHKWLLAPEGAGIFYCARTWLDALKPTYVSWRSVEDPFDFDRIPQRPADEARRFEFGTPPMPGIVGLHASMSLLLEVGIGRIRDRILALTNFARDGLEARGYRVLSPWGECERSGILTFAHPTRSPDELTELLARNAVVVTARGGGVRLSPHFYNNEEDLKKLLDTLP